MFLTIYIVVRLYKYIQKDDFYLRKEIVFTPFFKEIKQKVEAGNAFSLALIAVVAKCNTRTVQRHLEKNVDFRAFCLEMQAINQLNIDNDIVNASMSSKDTDSKLLIHRYKIANNDKTSEESAVDLDFAKEYDSISSERTQVRFDCLTKYYNNNKISLTIYNSHLNAIKLMQDAVVTPIIEAILEKQERENS